MLGFSNKGNETYRFSIVHYQGDMWGRGDAQPVAVVVTCDRGTYMMGVHPSNVEATSDLGQAVLGQLPHLLMEQVEEADKAGAEDVLGFMASENPWNLYLSEPETVESPEELATVGFQVFSERVMRFYQQRASGHVRPPANPLDNIFIRESAGGSFRRRRVGA